jgi:diguanylate cyclase (GGDEF)-like protein/PAS domain S-box-containing protein
LEREALWDWDLATDRVHFSPRWVALAGCEGDEVGNSPEEWLQRVHPEDLDHLLRALETVRVDGSSEFEVRHRLRHKSGAYRWMACRGAVVRNEDGAAVRLTGFHSDITVQTVSDPLTGLPNRLLLLDRVTQLIQRGRRSPGFHFAVLLIDLGRSTDPGAPAPAGGDHVLVAAARRLEKCVRTAGTVQDLRHNDFVARLENDLFAIALDGLNDLSLAKILADRILKDMLAPFNTNDRELFLPASAGIALSATGYVRAEDVLRDAEAALHRARVLGGSHSEVFDTAILKSEQAELQLESAFADSLEHRDFHLLYQPIVSLASSRVIGFEALVRWRHPVLGIIQPLDFIPIAERSGFIVPLGEWILREACSQLKALQAGSGSSGDVWMAVNLSSVQLKDPALVEQVADALRDSGVAPSSLVLELTEGSAMENPAAVKTVLMQLRAIGVRISVDDFGTGYSSLAYLRQFPVDSLKVDRSFVRDIATHKDTASIVSSLIVMARHLSLQVVAEGVEDDQQLAVLRSLHCESAQGYLFARPLEAAAAAETLKTGFPRRAGSHPAVAAPFVAAALVNTSDARPSFPTPRWMPIIAAALAVVGALGIFARLTSELLPSAGAASVVLPATAVGRPGGGGPADAGILARGRDTGATIAAPPPAAAVRRANVLPPPKPRVAPVRRLASFDVVHLHRMGSCQGRLVVSGDGVTFVPAQKGSSDTFALSHGDFLHMLEGGTLTVKSATRAYRFKAAGADGNDQSATRLAAVVASIGRFR